MTTCPRDAGEPTWSRSSPRPGTGGPWPCCKDAGQLLRARMRSRMAGLSWCNLCRPCFLPVSISAGTGPYCWFCWHCLQLTENQSSREAGLGTEEGHCSRTYCQGGQCLPCTGEPRHTQGQVSSSSSCCQGFASYSLTCSQLPFTQDHFSNSKQLNLRLTMTPGVSQQSCFTAGSSPASPGTRAFSSQGAELSQP